MALKSEKDVLSDHNDENNKHESSAPVLPSSQPQAETGGAACIDEETTYPEGGFNAWLVVFGAWCGTASSIGLYNTSGVFQAYMSEELLPNGSTSSIGWIFGIYAFVTWFLGVQIGPTFDAIGPTMLMIAGSACTTGGILALSACTGKSTSSCMICRRPHVLPFGNSKNDGQPPPCSCGSSSLTLKQSTINSSCRFLF